MCRSAKMDGFWWPKGTWWNNCRMWAQGPSNVTPYPSLPSWIGQKLLDVSDVHSSLEICIDMWPLKTEEKYVLMVHVIATFRWPVGIYSLQKERYQKHTLRSCADSFDLLISAFSGLNLFLWSLLSQLSWRQLADGRGIDKEDASTLLVQPSKFVL